MARKVRLLFSALAGLCFSPLRLATISTNSYVKYFGDLANMLATSRDEWRSAHLLRG
jgi:hypothetical protein